ncbi:alpha/beta hydrolase [Mariniblastus sp.]|nr:alpha/beta hydrolase [Mariniblastus sp.]
MNKFLANLADRMVLRPSTDPIDPEDRQRVLMPFAGGHLEAWTNEVHQHSNSPKLLALKFPGTGGRAERAGPHPCELWPEFSSTIWTINAAGYGGSNGSASLATMPAQAEAVFSFVRKELPDHKILLTGNSLGCISALYLAARHDVAGVFVRNPPPLQQLIAGRLKYNWWNFGMARFVAAQVPSELDSIANAARCTCPAFFLRSEKDTVVPAAFQRRIIDAYAGDLQEFIILGAEHDEFVAEKDFDAYQEEMMTFKEKWAS